MKKLWQDIDFQPASYEQDEGVAANDEAHQAELDLPLHNNLEVPLFKTKVPSEKDTTKLDKRYSM